jgi:pSer/pThr/pTyr-binding forkhead associated (FHA) protein
MSVYLMPLEKGRPIVLDKAVVFIGRDPDCDVVLTRSRKVSRKHCCIAQVNDKLVVRDLGSMNGVRINGKRIRKESRIDFGDEVSVGDCLYVLSTGAEMAVEEESDDGTLAVQEKSSAPDRAKALNVSQDLPVEIEDPGLADTPDAIPLVDADDEEDVINPQAEDILEEDSRVVEFDVDELDEASNEHEFDVEWMQFDDSGEFRETGSKV